MCGFSAVSQEWELVLKQFNISTSSLDTRIAGLLPKLCVSNICSVEIVSYMEQTDQMARYCLFSVPTTVCALTSAMEEGILEENCHERVWRGQSRWNNEDDFPTGSYGWRTSGILWHKVVVWVSENTGKLWLVLVSTAEKKFAKLKSQENKHNIDLKRGENSLQWEV